MSLLLRVVAEEIDPVMASFELGLCNMAEQDTVARWGLYRVFLRDMEIGELNAEELRFRAARRVV